MFRSFTYTETNSGTEATVQSDLFMVVLVAGIVFPLVLGAVGGLLWQQTNSSPSYGNYRR